MVVFLTFIMTYPTISRPQTVWIGSNLDINPGGKVFENFPVEFVSERACASKSLRIFAKHLLLHKLCKRMKLPNTLKLLTEA